MQTFQKPVSSHPLTAICFKEIFTQTQNIDFEWFKEITFDNKSNLLFKQRFFMDQTLFEEKRVCQH